MFCTLCTWDAFLVPVGMLFYYFLWFYEYDLLVTPLKRLNFLLNKYECNTHFSILNLYCFEYLSNIYLSDITLDWIFVDCIEECHKTLLFH